MSTPERARRPSREPMTAAGVRLAEVLCGVDGSPHAHHAASAALALAERLGVRLTLVHVAPTSDSAPGRQPSG